MSSNVISFSVVCPVYNSEEFISETLESILSQTYPAVEILIIDDGSVDNTIRVVQEIEKKSEVPITLIKGKHAGPGAARNLGIKASESEWIAFIDSDDKWEVDKLEIVADFIKKNGSKNIFCHGEYHVAENGNSTKVDYGLHFDKSAKLSPQLYLRNYFSTSAVVCKKDLILKYDGFDEKMMNAQDYELWLKISPDAEPLFISQLLGSYRLRDGNITSISIEKKFYNLIKIAWRYRGYVPYHFRFIKAMKMLVSYFKQKINRAFVYLSLLCKL